MPPTIIKTGMRPTMVVPEDIQKEHELAVKSGSPEFEADLEKMRRGKSIEAVTPFAIMGEPCTPELLD